MTDATKSELLRAAEEMLACVERNPGGYDYRPFFDLRRSSQLFDTDGAVIRLAKAVNDAGGHLPDEFKRGME